MEREPVRDFRDYARSLGGWLKGRGLVATHTGIFVVAATALFLVNIVRSPTDLWVWQPLLVWAIVLAIHGIVVMRYERRPAVAAAERRDTAPGSSLGSTVRSAAHHHRQHAARVLVETRGRLSQGTPQRVDPRHEPAGAPDHGWEVATRTWRDVPVKGDGVMQRVKDGSRRTWQRATTMLNHGTERVRQRLDSARRHAPTRDADSTVATSAPATTWSATAEPAGSKPATPVLAAREAATAASGEWVPPAVEALWPSIGATPTTGHGQAAQPVAPAANGEETWPDKPVSPALASPSIRLLTTPEREPDAVGYQHRPASSMEDVVLSGPAPRIEQPRQWSELQAEAAAWLARREEDMSKQDDSNAPSLLTPGENGHHSPKRERAQG